MCFSNVWKNSVNAITLGDVKRSNVLGWVETESGGKACYTMKLARVILTG